MAHPKEPLTMPVDPVLWTDSPYDPTQAKNHLHLWRFRLDLPTPEIEILKKLLSSDERLRAERLRELRKARDFIAARGQLRRILARYLHCAPAAIRFGYESAGKPFLVEAEPLFFNLSHSGAWGLLGVSGSGQIGVDLEYLDGNVDFRTIARQFFTASEQARLADLPPGQQRHVFFALWTAREARLKALGDGFSKPPGNRANPPLHVQHHWVAPDYLGALATESEGREMICWSYKSPACK